jgi:hypothetical protein
MTAMIPSKETEPVSRVKREPLHPFSAATVGPARTVNGLGLRFFASSNCLLRDVA